MLPDEQDILPERAEQLDDLDEDELLTVGEVADELRDSGGNEWKTCEMSET